MLSNIALWIDANAFPLLFTGLALHILCGIGVRRGVPVKALVVPANLGQIIAVIAVAIPFFLPQGGNMLRGALVVMLLWFLFKQNWNFYWHLKDHEEIKVSSLAALATMEMLSRLRAAGQLGNLDSETTDEREQVLVKAVLQSFSGTLVFPENCIWRLKNDCVSGQRSEGWVLQVALPLLRKALQEGPVLVRSYRLTVSYDEKGAVKDFQVKADGRSSGVLTPVTGAEGKQYLTLRE